VEEVFHSCSKGGLNHQSNLMTPQLELDTNGKVSKSNSFLSLGKQTTQFGGNFPQMTLLNQQKLEEKETMRVVTDESCDFFSDRHSDKALGSKFPESQVHPPLEATAPSKRSFHLFVFVHGFQASSLDMRAFRNHLQVLLPNAMFLVSQTNEKDTDSRIEELGSKLAEEVQEFVFTYLSGFQYINGKRIQVSLGKLSFIGHSLGGIIVREALKHLKSYAKQFHGYVSLGTPHLGYMYNSTSLVDAGIWLIKKFK